MVFEIEYTWTMDRIKTNKRYVKWIKQTKINKNIKQTKINQVEDISKIEIKTRQNKTKIQNIKSKTKEIQKKIQKGSRYNTYHLLFYYEFTLHI